MELIKSLLTNSGLSENVSGYLSTTIMIVLIALICVVANFITKKFILRFIAHIITKQQSKKGKIFLERKLFLNLSHIVPAIIIYYFASAFPSYTAWIEKITLLYMFVVIIATFNALLDAANDIYQGYEISKSRPIKGLIQVLKIVVFLIGGITLISILTGKNPLLLLSGLGALSAVLMLIFKDSILGFVAGVQLTSNDMLRVGDWIEMPKYNANGDVIDITLTTVKVQNWDKTIAMVPSYALVSDSFKNWKGMQDIGGRRIMRSIHIDITSIQFCTQDMLARFKKIHHLTDYIEKKEKEIAEYNKLHNINTETHANGRNLTNIGTFRIYIYNYLKGHPLIHQDLLTVVRQLESDGNGLPLQIYCFTNDTRWAVYEAAQADIFDHIIAVAPEFGLRIFQKPGSYDFHGYPGPVGPWQGTEGGKAGEE